VEALAWLAIPVVSTLVAILWLAVVNRPRPPASTQETVEAHARFREALRQADTPSFPATPSQIRNHPDHDTGSNGRPEHGAPGDSHRT
jgi:hypothetical protein